MRANRSREANEGNPNGANIEVKPIDASANPYLASALILEAALRGIEAGAVLSSPWDVATGPAGHSAGALLPTDSREQVERLEVSEVARRALGPEVIEAVAAVRRMEAETWGGQPIEARAERFRFTWG